MGHIIRTLSFTKRSFKDKIITRKIQDTKDLSGKLLRK